MTRKVARSLTVAAVAASVALVATACGAQSAESVGSSGPSSEGKHLSAEGRTSSPEATHQDPGAKDQLSRNARDAVEERARNSVSGDPVGPRNTDIPRPQDYGFGKAVDKAQGGEVIAYEPRLDGGRMVVPVTISNEGKQRASYEVTVTAVGNTGSSAVTVTKKAPGVFPGSTWPTQADVTTSEVKDAKELKITLRVVKENYGR